MTVRDDDLDRAAQLYVAVPGSPLTVAFADGASRLRSEWLEWARVFVRKHADGLDASARADLNVRISILEKR